MRVLFNHFYGHFAQIKFGNDKYGIGEAENYQRLEKNEIIMALSYPFEEKFLDKNARIKFLKT